MLQQSKPTFRYIGDNMKVVLIPFAFILAVNGAVFIRNQNSEKWTKFKNRFEKFYETTTEDARRRAIFIENQAFVSDHNERYNKGEETFKVELNKYSDSLPEEIKVVSDGSRPQPAKIFVPPENFTDADELNWVKEGAVVTEVKDQMKCSSSYAFSAAGALEGQMFLRKTGKLVSLSVQNIIDCSGEAGNQGCNGGNPSSVFSYVEANNGLNTEEVYPYEGKQGTCRYNSSDIGAICTGYALVPRNESILGLALVFGGPVSVTIDAAHKSFLMYKGGVYSEPECSQDSPNHAVLLVGFGVDPTTKKDYWLVKNSWGPNWGEQGYIKIARNANNMCGIASSAIIPLVKPVIGLKPKTSFKIPNFI